MAPALGCCVGNWDPIHPMASPFIPQHPHSPHGLPVHPTAFPHTPLPLHTPHYLPMHPGDAPTKSPWAYPKQGTAAQPQSRPYRQPGLSTSRPNPARCSVTAAWAAPGTSWRGSTQISTPFFSGFRVVLCFFLTCSKDRRLRGPHNLTGLTMFPRAAFLPAWPTTTRACLYGSPSPRVF